MTAPSQIVTPDTSSTEAIYATLRAALIAYERPPNGTTIRSLCGSDTNRVHVWAPPPSTPFPYLCLRLTRASGGAYNGYRETAQLEIQCIGRPESQLPLVQACMDIVDGAFLGYAEPGSGLMFSRERTRDTIPRFTEPADANAVGELSRFSFVFWPRVLTDLRPNP
jgi:hypothetical protein